MMVSGLRALILFIAVGISPLLAEGTNAAPAPAATTMTAAPAAAAETGFGTYLSDHQDELAPFFQAHTDDLVKQGLPLLLTVVGNVILLNLVVGWAFDVGLSYGFSTFFAPAYAKVKQALIYATGRVILSIIVGVVAGLIVMGLSLVSNTLMEVGLGVLVLGSFAVQTIFVSAIYRTRLIVAAGFYLTLFVVHIIAGTLITGPIIKARIANMMTQFVDQKVTSEMRDSTAEIKQQKADVEKARDKVKAEQSEAQNRLDQANAEQARLGKEIEVKKNSETFVYGRIARVHAQGDLTAARDQFAAYLARFPSGSMTDAARAQLAMLQSEIATAEARKKQAEADAAAAAAAARADLLARAAKGQVTLSEMREALIGKKRTEITDLFGNPSETGSDKWGYAQHMVINPLTNEKHGLAIYFKEGAVQGVDYYYGGGR